MTHPQKRPRGRPRSVDRQAAIDAAMDNYWRLGFSALSLNEICRRAGLSKPALYREFGGEDGLLAAALESYRERIVAPSLAALQGDRPFAQTLEGAIVGLTSDRGTPAGCLFTKLRIGGAALGPLAAEEVRKLAEEHRNAYEAFFRRGLETGEANSQLAPELAARYLDTQLAAVLVQMAVGITPARIREQARLAMQPLLA